MNGENITTLPERPSSEETSQQRRRGKLVLMHIPKSNKEPAAELPTDETGIESLSEDEEWLVYELVLRFDSTIDLPYAQKERHRHYLWNYCSWHVLNGTSVREIQACVDRYVDDCRRQSA